MSFTGKIGGPSQMIPTQAAGQTHTPEQLENIKKQMVNSGASPERMAKMKQAATKAAQKAKAGKGAGKSEKSALHRELSSWLDEAEDGDMLRQGAQNLKAALAEDEEI